MNQLLVVGGGSLDTLHLQDQSVSSAGGAGLYTAMAAYRAGTAVSLASPRPVPCPEPLQPVVSRLSAWFGPEIAGKDLPHFEISYRNGRTEYLHIYLEAEQSLQVESLPANLGSYDLVHITPLGDTAVQLAFIEACRRRGARRISAGTGLFLAAEHPVLVRTALQQSDYFFLNAQEAAMTFGSIEAARTAPGKLLFITDGAAGVTVMQGDYRTCVPALPAVELDPTGAGDSFCGAALAFLLQGQHPIIAAQRAAALAAEVVSTIGPSALLAPAAPPPLPADERARPNAGQIGRIAPIVAASPETTPYPFDGPGLPASGHSQALDYFFASTLQQFGFWYSQDGRYHRPLIAPLDGTALKGSDYLWTAYLRRLQADPEFCDPARQAGLTLEEMAALFRDDHRQVSMPSLEMHLQQANSYGRDMLALNLSPRKIVEMALASDRPLDTFLSLLDHIGGYKEDPLRKKSSLLAMILNQRPERFLPLPPDREIDPIVDYHAMRSCLRMGLVDVLDPLLERQLMDRILLAPADEWAVRFACYLAIHALVAESGRGLGDVDWFLFNARKRCPEMSEPECALCPVDAACAHRKVLFQPVIHTPFY